MKKNLTILVALILLSGCFVSNSSTTAMPYNMRKILKGKPDGTCVTVTKDLQLYPMKAMEKMPPFKYAAFVPTEHFWSKYNKSASSLIRRFVSDQDTSVKTIPSGKKLIYNGFQVYYDNDYIFNIHKELFYISLATTDGETFMIPYYFSDNVQRPTGAVHQQNIDGLIDLCKSDE